MKGHCKRPQNGQQQKEGPKDGPHHLYENVKGQPKWMNLPNCGLQGQIDVTRKQSPAQKMTSTITVFWSIYDESYGEDVKDPINQIEDVEIGL